MNGVIYFFIIAIFVFGMVATGINESHLYEPQMPNPGMNSGMASANETVLAMQKEAERPSVFSAWTQLNIMWKALWGGVVALFTLSFLLESYGIPVSIATLFMSPMALVIVFWAVEFWLGRNTS
jgi:hypothetical protein